MGFLLCAVWDFPLPLQLISNGIRYSCMQTISDRPSLFALFKEIDGIYLAIVSSLGLFFVGLGGFSIAGQPGLQNLFLLILFAALAEVAGPMLRLSKGLGVTYEVGTAVSLAAVPLFGAAGGSFVLGIAGVVYWLYKFHRVPVSEWKWKQLLFNIGNRSVAVFIAGSFLTAGLQVELAEQFWFITAVWLAAALILDQLNLWLLIILLRLLQGAEFSARAFWLENRWAMLVNIPVVFIGGFALSTATTQFGTIGLLVFVLPIALSTVANQLYVRQMRTHLDNLEAIVAERTAELQTLMKEKDAFLAVLTHDMKTPLTSINLYATLLLQKPNLIHEKPHLLETVVRSQKTLTNIVNDILDIETLQSDKELNLQFEVLDLSILLLATVETLQAQAMYKEITLAYEEPNSEIRVRADKHQIGRVFQNIISNAVKYTPDEGHVQVRIFVKEARVNVQVSDNGYGIPAEDLPHIFDRYRRVKKHKSFASGSGLGLAITKALVEAHQGEIVVNSVEGEGSTFTIVLPLAEFIH